MTAATDEYLAAQDTVRNWMAECTDEVATAETQSSHLFKGWKEWCEANGEFPGSGKAFSQKLTDLGLESRRAQAGTVFCGVRLRG